MKNKYLVLALLAVYPALNAQNLPSEILKDSEPAVRFMKSSSGLTNYIISFSNDRSNPELLGKALLLIDPKKVTDSANSEEWSSKEGRAAKSYLREKYNIDANIVVSWLGVALSAPLTDEQVKTLSEDKNISGVNGNQVLQSPRASSKSDEIFTTQSWLPPYSDGYAGGELIPWGLYATNAIENRVVNTVTYVIDYQLASELNYFDVNVVSRYNYVPNSTNVAKNAYHPTAVTGVIGARANNQLTRGINPGAEIISIAAPTDENNDISFAGIAAAFETAYVHAEQNRIFGVLNISMNGWGFTGESAFFSRGRPASWLKRWMAAASTRLFIAQSAGNNGDQACGVTYDSPSPVDGIMVVGGYDKSGFPGTNYSDYPSAKTNYGTCVEIWGPSTDMYVNAFPNTPGYYTNYKNNPDQVPLLLSGTSFAAPYVAAIAARYGDNNTRPPVRESYIRNTAESTGRFDGSGRPIVSVKYNANPSNVVKYLFPLNISSPQTNTDIWSVVDGRFTDDFWNAGGYSGRIDFQLRAPSTLNSVRITPIRSADGAATYTIYTSSDGVNYTNQGSVNSQRAYSLVPESFQLATPVQNVRYVRVDGTSIDSWLAISEIEFFGQ